MQEPSRKPPHLAVFLLKVSTDAALHDQFSKDPVGVMRTHGLNEAQCKAVLSRDEVQLQMAALSTGVPAGMPQPPRKLPHLTVFLLKLSTDTELHDQFVKNPKAVMIANGLDDAQIAAVNGNEVDLQTAVSAEVHAAAIPAEAGSKAVSINLYHEVGYVQIGSEAIKP